MKLTTFLQDKIAKTEFKKLIPKIIKRKQLQLYDEKRNIHYWALDRIIDYQTKKLRQLLRISLASSYYRKILNSIGVPIEKFDLENLKKLPILTKDIIRKEKENLLAKLATQLYPNSSGGSTGQPINFYQDDNYKIHSRATTMIAMEMCGWYYGARVARIWGVPQNKRKVTTLKEKLAYFFQNKRFYDSFNMSEERMLEYHNDMTEFQPEIIISYASSIYLLAQFLKSRGIKPAYPLISINSSAETLHPHMRKTVEEVFGAEVFDKYGSREVSAIACECESHKGLHIFMDSVIIECVDSKTGKDVVGQPGEIIVTDLNNYGMPFIRYRIGDMGILTAEKCSCGRNTLVFKQILGRNTDNFVMKDGRIIHGEYFTHLFYGIEGIRDFQFVQEAVDKFNLYLVRSEGFNEVAFGKIIQRIKEIISTNCELNVYFVDEIPKTPTGKYRFTISKINIENMWEN